MTQTEMFTYIPVNVNKYKPLYHIPEKIEFWFNGRIEWGYLIKEYSQHVEVEMRSAGIMVKVMREHIVE